jgi:hypothetical protein
MVLAPAAIVRKETIAYNIDVIAAKAKYKNALIGAFIHNLPLSI